MTTCSAAPSQPKSAAATPLAPLAPVHPSDARLSPSQRAVLAYTRAAVAYKYIPYRTVELYAWMKEPLGEENYAWFRAIRATELKRAFCFGLRENVVVDDDQKRCWSPASRSCFIFLFARVTESLTLSEMAIGQMPVTGGDFDGPRRELSRFVCCSNTELLPDVAVGRRLFSGTGA